jgi:two-component system chemotaxis response regulator CheB
MSNILVQLNSIRKGIGKDKYKMVQVNTFKNDIHIIAIGASTGGTEALFGILKALPPNMPPIAVVQHMPPVFTQMFAERLNNACRLEVKEAQNGDELYAGRVLLAPGEYQMKVIKTKGLFYVECFKGEKVNGHCPSVDVLFQSVAEQVGKNSVGIILTGMGRDGAKGLLAMRKKGAKTFGQDEKSCVVYGMPKAAYEIGAVEKQVPLRDIPRLLKSMALS